MRQRPRKVERAVLVHGERAGRAQWACAPARRAKVSTSPIVERSLVVRHTQDAAGNVGLHGVDAVEPEQLAAHLVHAAAALRGPRQQ